MEILVFIVFCCSSSKIINDTIIMSPKSFTKLFSNKSDKTEYHLRNISSNLFLPKPRADNMKNSFMYDEAKLWSSIPKDIRESQSLSSFRQKIAAHIFEYHVLQKCELSTKFFH